ncbi:unnamed protein product [Caenorhabditis auriculariae]|uniref:Uncharacterized protein n=1 Tax=Caenorhabditis auriculariae TaxID=2777116 RepID=A0A8S1HWM9_9PELO|nr:unnamed protein product [Caenorhabditis auriculariae]
MLNSKTYALMLFFLVFGQTTTVDRPVQVPDKDQTLKNLVYRAAVPEANSQFGDTYYWVPATQQFSATRITVSFICLKLSAVFSGKKFILDVHYSEK